jgi:hypothetical protein
LLRLFPTTLDGASIETKKELYKNPHFEAAKDKKRLSLKCVNVRGYPTLSTNTGFIVLIVNFEKERTGQ